MGEANRKKSLHDVLRERRAAKPLLSVRELQLREAARRRDEVDALAKERVERRRARGKSVDAEGKLDPAVYRAIFALDRRAYYGSRHWSRRSRAQLGLAAACEVARCGRDADLRVRHLHHDALGGEQPGRDLITLCDGCHRRVRKLGRDLNRVPTRAEIVAVDPAAPLYDPTAIAALKEKYGR